MALLEKQCVLTSASSRIEIKQKCLTLIVIFTFISGNDFDDNSANYFAEAISVSSCIIFIFIINSQKYLDLSLNYS